MKSSFIKEASTSWKTDVATGLKKVNYQSQMNNNVKTVREMARAVNQMINNKNQQEIILLPFINNIRNCAVMVMAQYGRGFWNLSSKTFLKFLFSNEITATQSPSSQGVAVGDITVFTKEGLIHCCCCCCCCSCCFSNKCSIQISAILFRWQKFTMRIVNKWRHIIFWASTSHL